MDINRGSQPHHARVRRLGKKAIFYGRIGTALGGFCAPENKAATRTSKLVQKVKAYRPTRRHWIIGACVFVLALASVFGYGVYQSQRAAAANAAAKAEAERVERVNAAAQVCYRKKTAEKQKMLDRITYDQLYDGDSCLTSQ